MGKTYKYDEDRFGNNYKGFKRFKKEQIQKTHEDYENEQWEDKNEDVKED